MSHFDLVIRNGLVVSSDRAIIRSIGILDGAIAEIGADIHGSAAVEVDATGATVLPGFIDPHVHFNEPGRADWEGWASGSAALAAGGGTSAIEMPLNAHPPTLDRASFDAKAALAGAASHTDFALWGGLTPTNIESLEELAEAGVIGFKAFMSASGTDDFVHADDDTLLRGMAIAARLGLPVAVHAENDAITSGRARRARAGGQVSVRDYLASRPPIAELEAIGRAVAFARETGARLHVVHVSTAAGVDLVTAAQASGVDVSCETCPHYLHFTASDVERIGALAKCAPPLRDAATRDALRSRLAAGRIDMIGSDHSPAPPSMKMGDDFFAIWGGISGCQHAVPAILTLAEPHDPDFPALARRLAETAARRFRLPGKGGIAVGQDADLALVRPQAAAPIPRAGIRYRHPASAWDSVPFTWRIDATWLRGVRVDDRPRGRLLRPSPPL